MKVYIAGKIGGLKPYEVNFKFGHRYAKLKEEGYDVISPVKLCACLEEGNFDYEDYMKICFAAIEVCDAVYMLANWKDSPGAIRERERARELGKAIIYEGDSI